MPRPDNAAPFSYRDNPTVPAFDDTAPLAIMDGDCALCTTGARLIARFDRTGAVRFCRSQSPLGRGLLVHYGFDPDDPESWLYLEGGHARGSLDGIIAVARLMGPVGWPVLPFGLLSGTAQDWLYRRIARNRYRLFGKGDMCAVPDGKLRARLLE